MPPEVAKRRFTVDEYHKMAASNIFEDERVELVEGEVVTMAPRGSLHTACVSRLNQLLTHRVGSSYLVRVQDPVVLGETTELEPDIAIVRYNPDYYARGHPSAKDSWLVVEVAASSLTHDREIKLPLYAKSGVPEAWLVDLSAHAVSVCSSPAVDGYERVEVKGPEDIIVSSSLPHLQVNVTDILGQIG